MRPRQELQQAPSQHRPVTATRALSRAASTRPRCASTSSTNAVPGVHPACMPTPRMRCHRSLVLGCAHSLLLGDATLTTALIVDDLLNALPMSPRKIFNIGLSGIPDLCSSKQSSNMLSCAQRFKSAEPFMLYKVAHLLPSSSIGIQATADLHVTTGVTLPSLCRLQSAGGLPRDCKAQCLSSRLSSCRPVYCCDDPDLDLRLAADQHLASTTIFIKPNTQDPGLIRRGSEGLIRRGSEGVVVGQAHQRAQQHMGRGGDGPRTGRLFNSPMGGGRGGGGRGRTTWQHSYNHQQGPQGGRGGYGGSPNFGGPPHGFGGHSQPRPYAPHAPPQPYGQMAPQGYGAPQYGGFQPAPAAGGYPPQAPPAAAPQQQYGQPQAAPAYAGYADPYAQYAAPAAAAAPQVGYGAQQAYGAQPAAAQAPQAYSYAPQAPVSPLHPVT